MADVVRLSSLRFSYFSPPSLTPSSSSRHALCPPQKLHKRSDSSANCSHGGGGSGVAGLGFGPRERFASLKAHATVTETNQPKWWERNAGPNMVDIHSTQEFLSALSQAGDRLVIVEFYGTWCASCKALFPKIDPFPINNIIWAALLQDIIYLELCRTAQEHPEILFLKVNFDENKPMCRNLSVKVLPYFHFYRGADGQLESFSCSLAKFQKIRDAIQMHNTERCSIGPPKGVGDLVLEPASPRKDKSAGATST